MGERTITIHWESEEMDQEIKRRGAIQRERDLMFQIKMVDWLIWIFVGCLVLIVALFVIGGALWVLSLFNRLIG